MNDILDRLSRFDIANLLGEVLNAIRSSYETGEHARALRWLGAWDQAVAPDTATLDALGALRTQSSFQAARQTFAGAAARRRDALQSFQSRLEAGSTDNPWRWAAVRYADAVRAFVAHEARRAALDLSGLPSELNDDIAHHQLVRDAAIDVWYDAPQGVWRLTHATPRIADHTRDAEAAFETRRDAGRRRDDARRAARARALPEPPSSLWTQPLAEQVDALEGSVARHDYQALLETVDKQTARVLSGLEAAFHRPPGDGLSPLWVNLSASPADLSEGAPSAGTPDAPAADGA